MKAYKISDSIADQYHGYGLALAAIVNGQPVRLIYLRDVVPEGMQEHLESQHGQFFVRQWLQTDAAAPVVRELQALGQVSVGMCSAWEFCEL